MTSNYTLTWSRDMVRDGGTRRRWMHRLPWARPTSGWIVADAYGQVLAATPYLGMLADEQNSVRVAQAWASALIATDGHSLPHLIEWEQEYPPSWVGRRWRGFVVDPERAVQLAEHNLADLVAQTEQERAEAALQ